MKLLYTTSLTILLLLVSCSNKKTITLANGKKMSEKEFNKMITKNVEEGLKKLSSEEQEIILNSNIKVIEGK